VRFFTFKKFLIQNHEKLFSIALLFVSVILFAQDKAPNYVAANYTKKKCISRCGWSCSLLVFILQRIFQKVSYYNAKDSLIVRMEQINSKKYLKRNDDERGLYSSLSRC
jgi:hypothetical protein